MRYAIIVLLVCVVLALSGCTAVLGLTSQSIRGSGNLATREYDVTGFDVIDAGSNFRVNLQRGDGYAVKVTADDNIIDHLDVTSSGGKLTLGIKPGGWSLDNVTMTADVTLPALKAVTGRSNAVIGFERFEPANFTLQLSGNAVAQGEVNAGQVSVVADGNAQARLAGASDQLDTRGRGNAVLTLSELAARQVNVDLINNAMATVQATESLDYSVGGNAGLTYGGGAKVGKQQAGGNAWARQK